MNNEKFERAVEIKRNITKLKSKLIDLEGITLIQLNRGASFVNIENFDGEVEEKYAELKIDFIEKTKNILLNEKIKLENEFDKL